jgi:uncharacterized protein GlcG (DUF336 family)
MLKRFFMLAAFFAISFIGLRAAPASAAPCSVPQRVVNALNSGFIQSLASGNGGFFTPNLMWGAVAKAETANDFSNEKLSLSTANLYGLVVPGGSLFGLSGANTYNPIADDPRIPVGGAVPGGIITFGGGVALYSGGQVIGGFGVSGDTSCADHAVAYEARTAVIKAHVISPPPNDDNIVYGTMINSTEHPHCTSHDHRPPSF